MREVKELNLGTLMKAVNAIHAPDRAGRVLCEAAKLLRASGEYKVTKRLNNTERTRRSEQAKRNFAPGIERLTAASIASKARQANSELRGVPSPE